MLDRSAENLTEPAPVFLVRGTERIQVPAILLEVEHLHAAPWAGDGRLHVTARDPHWLYVHWDLTRDQQAKLNAASRHGHLIVRVYLNSLESAPAGENPVHPQSRHWFTHVETPGATYYAELGYYSGPEWRRVAVAGPVTTPRQRFAFDTSATYVTVHPDRPLVEQLGTRRGADEAQLIPGGEVAGPATEWSTAQQRAVLRALGVIRICETTTDDSGAGKSAAAEEGVASFRSETELPGSASQGFGVAPGSPGFASGYSISVSSADAPLFSLTGFPNPSS